ncbi:MAG: SPOR domain-containing protein [Gammaproteobacteria bacterium]|nr:SPOR domain-containing protein [Gammaproteobacteria bacterium]MDE0223578.1 SPOR domain-containing protein [Gammaproteobacteria bacterium]
MSSFAAGLIAGVAVCMVTVYLIGVPESADQGSADTQGVPEDSGDDPDGAQRFEFFESLPAAEVPTDTEPYKTLTPGGYVPPSEYLVQAGSFRDEDDANRLRARLMLTGMDADITINTLDQEDGTWHRVVVGPFTSRENAEKMVASLQEHEVSPILLQVPPTR